MKNQVISLAYYCLCCCCLCLIGINQNLSAQNCPSVTGFSGASNGTHMDLQWNSTAPQGRVRYEIRYHTNLGTSFFRTNNTSLKITQTPGAQYELYGIVPHYPDGCQGIEVFWTTDIIITIDDVYSKITDSCYSERFLSSNVLVNWGGTIYSIPGAQLCCLMDYCVTQTNAYAMQQAMFTAELYYYFTNGGVFSSKICDEYEPSYEHGQQRTGNVHNASENLDIYPNPSQNTIYVQIPDIENQGAEISIVSLTGQLMKRIKTTKANTTTRIDIGEISAGMYTIKLDAGEHSYFGKLIKQ